MGMSRWILTIRIQGASIKSITVTYLCMVCGKQLPDYQVSKGKALCYRCEKQMFEGPSKVFKEQQKMLEEAQKIKYL